MTVLYELSRYTEKEVLLCDKLELCHGFHSLQVSETISVAEFKAVAIGIVFRLVNDFSTCLPHGLLNLKCWQIVSFPIHDVLQRISL